MTETSLENAVTRLERAIARMERAANACDADAIARLAQRHDRLRGRVRDVIDRLDGLIAPGEGAR